MAKLGSKLLLPWIFLIKINSDDSFLFGAPPSAAGYPSGVMATTSRVCGTPKISSTFLWSNNPITTVPRPSECAVKQSVCMAIPVSNINQSPLTVAASPFLKPETPFFPQTTRIKGALRHRRKRWIRFWKGCGQFRLYLRVFYNNHFPALCIGPGRRPSQRLHQSTKCFFGTRSALYFRMLRLPLIASIQIHIYLLLLYHCGIRNADFGIRTLRVNPQSALCNPN